jgi:hypothetical protein
LLRLIVITVSVDTKAENMAAFCCRRCLLPHHSGSGSITGVYEEDAGELSGSSNSGAAQAARRFILAPSPGRRDDA